MTRKILITLLAVSMSAHFSACSSNSSKDDASVAQSNDETFAEEGEGDFADDSAKKTASATEATDAPADNAGESVAATDAKPEDGAGDLALDDQAAAKNTAENAETSTTTIETTETADAKPADELSLDDPGALPDEVASKATPPVENITDNPAAPSDAGVFEQSKEVANSTPPAPEPVSEPVIADTSPAQSSYNEPAAAPKQTVFAPLLKVKESAFTAPGGETLNRVYLARPKDTAKSMSQKLYGDAAHAKQLAKWNPVLKRGVRAGDKVYYSSAANPSDTHMMNFYEEAGIAPQSYVSKDGDNLRTVSKDLLGFKDAWKEVWSTNASVESKGKIPSGLEIKYWPETGTAAPVQALASTTAPPADTGAALPSTLPDAAPTAPSSPQASAQASAQGTAEMPPNDPFASAPPQVQPAAGQAAGQAVADNGAGPDPLAPPPPVDMAPPTAPVAAAAAGTVAADPMAPPAPAAQVAAKPPLAPKPAKKVVTTTVTQDNSDDTTMALGVGGVLLLAAAALFIFIRKNRAKRMDLGQTQV